MLPPSFFDALSDRLELAVYDTNAEYQMQRAEIVAELGDVPGVDTLSVRYGDGLQFVTYNGRTTALPESASIDEIRRALNLQKIDSIIAPVAFADMAQTAEIPNMATIAEQIRAAKEKIAGARQGAASAVAETAQVANLAAEEVAKLDKMNEELRAELAGLNGGEPL